MSAVLTQDGRQIEALTRFTRIELLWRGVCPGVVRLVRIGATSRACAGRHDRRLRKREHVGAIDPPNEKRGKCPGLATVCRSFAGAFAGRAGLCTQVPRQQIAVLLLLLMFKAPRSAAACAATLVYWASANARPLGKRSVAKVSCEIGVSINETVMHITLRSCMAQMGQDTFTL